MNYYPSNRMSADSPNDRKTRALNKLIYGLFRKDILSENSTLRALYVVKSYTGCYTIVFEMDGEYRSDDILNWIIISTVDKILEWWDITDSYNLDVEYVTRGRRPINKNYFELMFHSYIKNSNKGYSRDGVDNFHPRFTKMCRWMHYHKPQEYQSAINRTYDPYRYRENHQAQQLAQQRAQFGELDHPGYGQLQQRGIQQGYYNYDIDNLREQSRQQRMMLELEGRRSEPIVERVSSINRLRKLLKI